MTNELADIDQRLAEIEQEKADLLARKSELRQARNIPVSAQLTPNQKVELFRSFFRGRSDVYAIRWQGTNGRSGYAVACENEWAAGICQKPGIKCGDCQHRQFKPLDFNAVYGHLAGAHVAGLYPLLPDNRCYLLAVDFDKDDWRAEVQALARACRNRGISYLVEISQSGSGAHLWIFFSESVSAWAARALGSKLLDDAMELRAQKTVTPEQVHELVGNEPGQNGLEDVAAPWEQSLPIETGTIAGCPEKVAVTLANHIYIKVSDLPAPLIARLRRLASFANPVFFKTQALRFSTHGIPRYISCARIEQGYISIPRGCFDDLEAVLKEQGIAIELDDRRISGQELAKIRLKVTLRAQQEKAVKSLTERDTGILHAPTAFGKTVTAIGVIANRKVNTLILTHSRQLLDQWKERLETFIDGTAVGVIGGGKKKPTGQIDVATYQSLINKKDNTVSDLVRQYGQVIIDECHHISAPRYEMLLNEVCARYVFGLTATPDRQDGHQKIMFMVAGPVRHKVRKEHSQKFAQRVIVRERHDLPPADISTAGQRPHVASVYHWLSQNPSRNDNIVQDVVSCAANGAQCLVLTERREHAEVLAHLLDDQSVESVVLRGGMGAKERRAVEARLSDVQVIVATGKYVGEGFDLPRLDTLFLALPIAWKGTLSQYAGRLHREADGKQEVTIYDYLDTGLPMLERMYRKREKGYKAMGYQFSASGQTRLL